MQVKSTVVLALLAGTLLSCGDGIGGVTDPTSGGSTPTPTPRPGATPTPTATPAATPTPSTGLTCQLASLPDCAATGCCERGGTPLFTAEVERAMNDLENTRPDLFGAGGKVRDNLVYLQVLAQRITQLTGLCTKPEGHDEIRVKRDQTVAQHVDVLISDEFPAVVGVYTCRPASF